jgi:DNA-binding NarL/FixJ family response regulator
MIRLLIVSAEPSVRRGLLMNQTGESDVTIVGDLSGMPAATELATCWQPDVVVLDVDALRPAASDLTPVIKALAHCECVVISLWDDLTTRARWRAAGVTIFVSKCDGIDVLLGAIRQAAHRAKNQNLSHFNSDIRRPIIA